MRPQTPKVEEQVESAPEAKRAVRVEVARTGEEELEEDADGEGDEGGREEEGDGDELVDECVQLSGCVLVGEWWSQGGRTDRMMCRRCA